MTVSEQLPISIQIDERELQSLTEKNLERLEQGMRLVDHYVPVGFGIIDSLCLDKDNNPVVIEFKAAEDEDQSALIQSLDYSSWVDKNPDTIIRFINEKKRGVLEVNKLGDVRIIIVAPMFDQRTINAAEMVDPNIALIKYHCFEHSQIGRWLHFEPIYDSRTIRPRALAPQAYRIEDHFDEDYAAMRPIFDALVDRLKKEIGDFTVYAKKYYIAFQRTFNFAVLYVYKNKIEVGLTLHSTVTSGRLHDGSNWGWSRINYTISLSKPSDIDDELIDWLKESYSSD